jgi:hypothetical protein
MPKAIRVLNWETIFMKSDLRKTQAWHWLAMPIKFDGRGLRRLSRRNDGMQVLGAFLLICEVAATMPEKGLLIDTGGLPVTSDELEVKTGFKGDDFEHAFKILTDDSERICWFAWEELSRPVPIHPDASGSIPSTLQDSTGQNRTGQTGCTEPDVPARVPPVSPALLEFPIVGRGRKVWEFTQERLADLSSTFPDLDVLAESRKALGWIRANGNRKKTFQGMPKFLFSWMSRAQNSGAARYLPAGRNGHEPQIEPAANRRHCT